MAITYVGSASTPTTTGGSNATSPTVVDPATVGTMYSGDLVVVVCRNRLTADTHAVSDNGGQSWTKLTTYSDASGLLCTVTYFWCRFNGTWDTSPSFSHGGTNNSCLMLVFRPTAGTNTWLRDVTEVAINFAAPSTPFDITLTGITCAANSVAIGSFSSRDDNTWAMQSSGSWVQSRTINNMSGSDGSDLTCYILMPSGGATGNLIGRETANGGDTGVKYIISFKEVNAYQLWGETGIFIESGQNAILLWKHALLSALGSFILTGNNAILTYTLLPAYELWCGAGGFIETGNSALLKLSYALFAGLGEFVETCNNARLAKSSIIQSSTGQFILTGMDAILSYIITGIYNLLAETGSFILNGKNAYLLQSYQLQSDIGEFVLIGYETMGEYGMGTRTVTGTIYHLDGTAWASGIIKFELLDAFETATETYPKEIHSETLDANGAFSITLGVPDSGTAHYQVETPDHNIYEFYLAAGAATTLETILLISGSPVSQDAVQTLIDANNVMTITNVDNTYVVQDTDEWIRCDGTFMVTLPEATGSGNGYLIMNIGTGIITVDGNGSDTINGALTQSVATLDSLFILDVADGKWDAR